MKLSFPIPLNTVTRSCKVHSNIAKARRYKAKAFLSGGRINKTALRGGCVCLSVCVKARGSTNSSQNNNPPKSQKTFCTKMKDVREVQSSNTAADGKLIELGSFLKGMRIHVHVCVYSVGVSVPPCLCYNSCCAHCPASRAQPKPLGPVEARPFDTQALLFFEQKVGWRGHRAVI